MELEESAKEINASIMMAYFEHEGQRSVKWQRSIVHACQAIQYTNLLRYQMYKDSFWVPQNLMEKYKVTPEEFIIGNAPELVEDIVQRALNHISRVQISYEPAIHLPLFACKSYIEGINDNRYLSVSERSRPFFWDTFVHHYSHRLRR